MLFDITHYCSFDVRLVRSMGQSGGDEILECQLCDEGSDFYDQTFSARNACFTKVIRVKWCAMHL